MFGFPIGRLLVASIIAGIIGVGGLVVAPSPDEFFSNIHIESPADPVQAGETFTTDIVVVATEPVNVFKGLLRFDSTKLRVESIDYNTSIADLWAEEPWYSNGEGTLGFVGGTTNEQGFNGSDTLISVTFRALDAGETTLTIEDVHLLLHDGLGTSAAVGEPIESIFTIEPKPAEIMPPLASSEKKVSIVARTKSTDLNGDGEHTIADVSIFMIDLTRNNLRSDFDDDGRVTIKDLSMMLP